MKEAFEKIIERLEEEALNVMLPDGFRSSCVPLDTIKHIVNQVAEEFATDINVGNSWKIIYDKVLELEKEYAMSGDIDNVNDCIRLENLLQYFKEELREENNQSLTEINQSLTNGGWIPCSEKTPEFEIYTLTPMWVIMRKKDGTCCFVTRLKWNGYHGRWEWDNGKVISETWEVIAWKEIKYPEPYKPEGE